jgi:hypothetical protein
MSLDSTISRFIADAPPGEVSVFFFFFFLLQLLLIIRALLTLSFQLSNVIKGMDHQPQVLLLN